MTSIEIIELAKAMATDKYTRLYEEPLYCFNSKAIEAFFHAAQKLERESCAIECDKHHYTFIGRVIRNRWTK